MARELGEPFYKRYSIAGALHDPVTGTMMALTAAGAAVSAAGTIAGGNSARQAGDYAANVAAPAAQQAQEFKAKQLNQQAVQTRAVAQREAMETGLKTTYALSSLQANAGASGGGATDPGIISLTGNIAGRGKYLSLADMYKGENQARGLEAEAEGATYTGELDLIEGRQRQIEGEAKQSASRLSAAGTVLGGAGSMFKQYGDYQFQQAQLSNPYYSGRSVG